MRDKGRVVLSVCLALVLGALVISILGNVFSLVQTNRTVTSIGSVKGIGVGIYWDSSCTNPVSSINWGVIEPGSNRTVTIYIRNEGNTAVTLSRTTQNWNPTTSSNYMTLNWTYSGQTLSVNQVLLIRLMLVVSSNISGITNFSFDITITASG